MGKHVGNKCAKFGLISCRRGPPHRMGRGLSAVGGRRFRGRRGGVEFRQFPPRGWLRRVLLHTVCVGEVIP